MTTPLPPVAARPVIRTESELEAERQARIASGEQTPVRVSRFVGGPRGASTALPPPPRTPRSAIRADVLMVNSTAITVAEILYPLRDELAALRSTQTEAGFRERAEELLRRDVQRQIGSVLLFDDAMKGLGEDRRSAVERVTDEELARLKAAQFEGSVARLASHLDECGLTAAQHRELIRRDIVVRQYMRERYSDEVTLRREDLLRYYREHPDEFSSKELRELLIMEFPFAASLPAGVSWESATAAQRAAARLASVRRARTAHEALATRPFGDVARELSQGLHAADGGVFGLIGMPLQPPLDGVSAKLFELPPNGYTEPAELPDGWCIVGRGRTEPGVARRFADAQDEIRRALTQDRFDRLTRAHIMRLAERATVSSVDAFVQAAVRAAEHEGAGEPGAAARG